MPSQTRYEAGTQLPKADYLIGLGENGVDVRYVLTGNRSSDVPLPDEANQLLSAFHALPANMKRAAVAILETLREESKTDRTLQQSASEYRPG